jgi:hypothetical protein
MRALTAHGNTAEACVLPDQLWQRHALRRARGARHLTRTSSMPGGLA